MRISVVIPVYNSRDHLRECLEHLNRSTHADFECIVVDDHSTDDSAAIARDSGAVVLPMPKRGGPARARNAGALLAGGDILYFIDADVCVCTDTLARIATAFDADPRLDALIGSYDDRPAAPDFLSQYRNLMHCYVHQISRADACSFWSGCGAIRRPLFLQHDGFSEDYRRPAIEDIELGYRLRRAQCKIRLDKDLLVKHHKQWTFWKLVKTDLFDRGIPWTQLMLRDGRMVNDLNLQLSQRLSVALTLLLLIATAVAGYQFRSQFVTPMLAILFFVLMRYWLQPASQKMSKGIATCFAVTSCSLAALAFVYHMTALLPLIAAGVLLATLRRLRIPSLLRGGFVLVGVATSLAYLPREPVVLIVFTILAALLTLNRRFYFFVAAKQGRLSALAALPFHILFYVYNGVSFGVGLTRHLMWVMTDKSTDESVAVNSGGD